jgi:protein TonB
MFEDSLLESGGRLKTKRGRTTTFAIILEVGLIGLMVLMPLIFTEALPKQQLMTFLVAPPPPPPPPPPAAAPVKVVKQIQTDIVNGELRTPTKIPQKVQMIKEEEAPPPAMASSGVVGGVPGGIPGGQMGGVIGGIISSTPVAVPKVATPQRVRVSAGVTQGLKIKDAKPVYPPLARQARIQGQVLLRAVIGKDGSIINLQLVSGHPMLVQSALDAVKQWRYKPYLLNGEPVEVDTEILVNFTLSGG